MQITLTQSDIKRIIKDTEKEIDLLENTVYRSDAEEKACQEEITERREMIQYLRYNVKLFARDGKK